MSGGSFSERSFICSEIEAVSGITKISQRISWGVTSKALAILQTYSIETVEEPFSIRFIKLVQRIINNCYIKPMPLPLH